MTDERLRFACVQVGVRWPLVEDFLVQLQDEEVCASYVTRALAMLRNAEVFGPIKLQVAAVMAHTHTHSFTKKTQKRGRTHTHTHTHTHICLLKETQKRLFVY